MQIRATTLIAACVAVGFSVAQILTAQPTTAEQLPWGKAAKKPQVITPSSTYEPRQPADDEFDNYDTSSGDYGAGKAADDTYEPQGQRQRARKQERYQQDPDYSTYRPAVPQPDYVDEEAYGEDTRTRRKTYRRQKQNDVYVDPGVQQAPSRIDGTFSADEIVRAGHGAFGRVARGFAGVVEHVFRKRGRPNGYIIGQEAGGAIVAGLRYGEGILHTKDAGTHTVYWQGPSVGYDFGAEGSKTMILVYDMHHPSDVYGRFGGVDGSAYLVGGVGVTFQQKDHVTMAPIRSGVGLRLGANIGYLKYSRAPTWNPF